MQPFTNVSPETIALFEGEGYYNRLISRYELIRRLEAHGNFYINGTNDAIYVQDEDGDFTINTTKWTLFDLLDYLNY